MNTKKSRLFIALLLIMTILSIKNTNAQTIELNGFYGWQLTTSVKFYDGEFMLQNAPNYGGKLAVGLSSTTFAEISYMRSDTEGWFKPYNISIEPGEDITVSSNYIQIGGLQEVDMGGRIRPFATLALGTVIWAPKEYSGTKWQFAATLGAGLKIWLSDNIGLRAQGSMMLPMVWNGAGFGCGIGTGGSSCGGSIYTRITPFQGEFSGGLIIRITPN